MTIRKSHLLKITLFVALVSTTLYATINFNPASMPPLTVASYALKSSVLSTANNHAYRPWFENGAWQGDLIEYDLATDGTRTTDANPGSNPPLAGTNNWMARATFASKENPSGDLLNYTTYWQEGSTGRNIFTVGSAGTQADFLWSNLSDAQKTALDAATFTLGLTNAYDSPVLNYVRGDRSNEKFKGGTFRNRYSLLGDIINSDPVYFAGALESYTIAGYPAFKDSVKNRDGRIAVGANDGMLHVFDEDDGSEVYAYVPSMLFDKLGALKAVPYVHTYFVDGKITVASAKNGANWISALVGTLGAGGKGLYALNVTNADMSNNKVLFEKTGNDIGYILSRPRITRKNDNKWYVFTGNGLNSTTGVAKLLMFELDGSTYPQTEISTGVAGGLSAPVLVDSNKDFKADIAYAGDTNGDMWKFYLGSSPPSPNPVKIFDGSADRPILSAPAVSAHPNGGHMVMWATGSLLSLAEAANINYPSQAIYGIWDSAIGSAMVTQVMLEEANADFGSNTSTVRYIDTNNTIDYVCAARDATCTKGWVVVLPDNGERAYGPLQVRAGRVTMVSSTPFGADIAETDLVGDSWLISLNYLTGADRGQVVFDLSGDGYKNNTDKANLGTVASPDLRPPVAVNLGSGNISQPVMAHLEGGTDIMYINGLRLPFRISETAGGPLTVGHIDVHTDSPSGGSTAVNARNKHSRLYNTAANDGVGGDVDGHVHRYDTVNNVHYVDLFRLEPRRGKMSTLPVETTLPPCDSTTENEKSIEVDGKCMQVVEGELNRLYDILQTDVDGDAETSAQSEVYAYGSTTPLSATDKFIVVVANGDLSPAGKLQIGCRTWNVAAYENMMASQLEAGVAPKDLDDTVNGVTAEGNLVFTLAEIAGGTADSSTCPAESVFPTLRVSFSSRSILDGLIHGTRTQCVLGMLPYQNDVDYWDDEVLCWAPKALRGEAVSCAGLTEPPAGYIKDPALNLHITEDMDGTGYRWRNGALTLQLLKVNADDSAGYTLQPTANLPVKSGTRMGGTYAKAYIVTGNKKNPAFNKNTGPNESGMMYEASMYWHFGDFAQELQRSSSKSISCYGQSNWGAAYNQETRGVNSEQYATILAGIADDVLATYDSAVLALEAALAGNSEAALQAAVLAMAELLASNPELEKYHQFRDYAPGNMSQDELRDIDKERDPSGGGPGSDGDVGGPADAENIDGLDTDTIGSDYKPGRRTWLDLLQ